MVNVPKRPRGRPRSENPISLQRSIEFKPGDIAADLERLANERTNGNKSALLRLLVKEAATRPTGTDPDRVNGPDQKIPLAPYFTLPTGKRARTKDQHPKRRALLVAA
jgi:hypothetical protein